MTTARDVMHQGAECIGENDSLEYAALRMRELDVGALPICGEDDRLHGIVTDRDIVVKCIAAGRDPATVVAGEFAQGRPFTVEADQDIANALSTMEEHQIRRLPVTDQHRLVGMISEADLGRTLPEKTVGEFVEAVYAKNPF